MTNGKPYIDMSCYCSLVQKVVRWPLCFVTIIYPRYTCGVRVTVYTSFVSVSLCLLLCLTSRP